MMLHLNTLKGVGKFELKNFNQIFINTQYFSLWLDNGGTLINSCNNDERLWVY